MNEKETSITLLNPPHPWGIIRDSRTANGWTVTATASKLGVGRQTLSRLLNGHTGITPTMALALERIGWSNAEFWMRLQSGWELAREGRNKLRRLRGG